MSDTNRVARPEPARVPSAAAPPVPATPEQLPNASRWTRYAEVLVALAVVLLGVIILVETQDIRVTRATARVGPRVIPTIVGWGLVVIGLWYAVELLRGQHARPAADSEDVDISLPPDWVTIAGIGAGLIAYMLLIERAGFIVASTALFTITAFSMGSRNIFRDVGLGIVIAIAAYLSFSEGLGVDLPEGILEGLIG